eukprot:CCRYP_014693-RD/>CCRYP_014693-RD protein AED:0.00 eAED:0.00 QI:337/1/1/1/1/1/2/214/628
MVSKSTRSHSHSPTRQCQGLAPPLTLLLLIAAGPFSVLKSPIISVVGFTAPLSSSVKIASISAQPKNYRDVTWGSYPSLKSSLNESTKNHNTKRGTWTMGTDASNLNLPKDDETTKSHAAHKSNNIFRKVYHLYIDYFDKLWAETDVARRKKVEKQKAVEAVLRVKNMVSASSKSATNNTEEALLFSNVDDDVLVKMSEACDLLLDQLETQKKKNAGDPKLKLSVMGAVDISAPVASFSAQKEYEGRSTVKILPSLNERGEWISPPVAADNGTQDYSDTTELTRALAGEQSPIETNISSPTLHSPQKATKKGRSVLFGATMGLIVAAWVYSGNYIFTTLFTLMTALGQLEYYRMVMNTGIYPARRISVLGACAMFVSALFAPDLHQLCLPVFSTMAMIWFLTKRKGGTSISDIATTFTGMFYLGYIPSYWVRLRLIGAAREPTRLAPLIKPILDRISDTSLRDKIPKFLPKTIHLPVTTGANFIFWTWLCIAFSDVGGYFAGRKFGKTKLSALSPAAGKASPNKTVEGVIGGCAFSIVLATLGAWVQKWPYWAIVGPIHGVIVALLGLVGDLTASMLKRDAGLKDFGDLIPEHGGIMDRVDSYVSSYALQCVRLSSLASVCLDEKHIC